jgi:hypothetical protein
VLAIAKPSDSFRESTSQLYLNKIIAHDPFDTEILDLDPSDPNYPRPNYIFQVDGPHKKFVPLTENELKEEYASYRERTEIKATYELLEKNWKQWRKVFDPLAKSVLERIEELKQQNDLSGLNLSELEKAQKGKGNYVDAIVGLIGDLKKKQVLKDGIAKTKQRDKLEGKEPKYVPKKKNKQNCFNNGCKQTQNTTNHEQLQQDRIEQQQMDDENHIKDAKNKLEDMNRIQNNVSKSQQDKNSAEQQKNLDSLEEQRKKQEVNNENHIKDAKEKLGEMNQTQNNMNNNQRVKNIADQKKNLDSLEDQTKKQELIKNNRPPSKMNLPKEGTPSQEQSKGNVNENNNDKQTEKEISELISFLKKQEKSEKSFNSPQSRKPHQNKKNNPYIDPTYPNFPKNDPRYPQVQKELKEISELISFLKKQEKSEKSFNSPQSRKPHQNKKNNPYIDPTYPNFPKNDPRYPQVQKELKEISELISFLKKQEKSEKSFNSQYRNAISVPKNDKSKPDPKTLKPKTKKEPKRFFQRSNDKGYKPNSLGGAGTIRTR